uniref:Uncharacterized protein n=1 Tax=Lotharella globosa TaxID=91324 RepID=A0A6V3U8U1_9EUKA|mmetsp:Transcript_3089/g.6029  ORF Transcript_3089/g.6029 Transcript_3089/m.6029 type:complete len:124 (-) Transcript_3089:274-645(-)|eukprot:CAMPEP_0167771980 /NCGR_PEP_ID=MMETSP0111_2-20121227/588_1 /TAXON_ID=91324 /ORGANISM="Lotharella globosa, Strain CCCM811" /LENGTH=123 /DNA_ID=CAMNT_0007661411 /DNA_START=59 /DNA_END=430 /DNA_ORIENTATION=+
MGQACCSAEAQPQGGAKPAVKASDKAGSAHYQGGRKPSAPSESAESRRNKVLAAAEKRLNAQHAGGAGTKKKSPRKNPPKSIEQMKRIDAGRAKPKTDRKTSAFEEEHKEAFGAAVIDTRPKA